MYVHANSQKKPYPCHVEVKNASPLTQRRLQYINLQLFIITQHQHAADGQNPTPLWMIKTSEFGSCVERNTLPETNVAPENRPPQ